MPSFVIDFRYIEQLEEQTGDGINCNHTMMYIKEISSFDKIILTGGNINIAPLLSHTLPVGRPMHLN